MKFAGFDLETHLIRPGCLTPPIVCASWAVEKAEGLELGPHGAVQRLEQLADAGFILAGANIAYDFGCILAARPDTFAGIWALYESGRVWDVSIAATLNAIADGRLTDEALLRRDGSPIRRGRYSLSECVLESLGRSDAKRNDGYRLRYKELDGVPLELWPMEAREYPIDDAVNSFQVAKAQLGGRNTHQVAFQSHLAFCAHLGAIWGIRTDAERVADAKAKAKARFAEIREFAKEHGFLRATVKKRPDELSKDIKAIREAVFRAYQGHPPCTETGRVSTERQVLEDSGDRVLEKLAEYSKAEKAGTYLDALEAASQVPLNVRCNPMLATGRASYEGIIQLIPREGGFRECFTARPGYVYSSVDYAAIEMSTFAQVCFTLLGWSHLRDAINAGQDIHSVLAADLLGKPYEAITENHKVRPAFKSVRQAGKAGNFGFPGMMGVTKFVLAQRRQGHRVCEWLHHDGKCGEVRVREWRDNDTPVPMCLRCLETSESIRQAYLARWQEVRPYWAAVTSMLASQNDSVVQLFSQRIRGRLRAPQAANTLFQGLAADGAKSAVIAITKECYLQPDSPLYGSRLVVFSHDETILEVPESRAHEAAYRQADIMVQEMKRFVPDVAVKAEPALMRYWTKAAEAKFENGRLVPWC